MKFSPEHITIKKLMKTYEGFSIPMFQRDYSWDKIYIEQFIKDTIKRISEVDGHLQNNEYFIGTMVFSGDSNKVIDVVDGQQRLTIITIIFSVLTELFKEENKIELAKGMFKYIRSEDDSNRSIRILNAKSNINFFESYVQAFDKPNDNWESNSEEEDLLREAYELVYKLLSKDYVAKFNNKLNEHDYSDVLEIIRDQILYSTVISIETQDKKNAYMIFEILNAKGKSLASVDLIKNKILEQFYEDTNGEASRIESLWNSSKDNLHQRDLDIGFSTFFRHYWISKYEKVKNVDLYKSFLKQFEIEDNKLDREKLLEFLNELEKESKYYIQLIKPYREDFNNQKQFFGVINSLNTITSTFSIVQTRVLFLALFDLKNREIIKGRLFIKTIKYLENYIFLNIIMGEERTNSFEKLLSDVAIKLRNAKSNEEASLIIENDLKKVLSSNKNELSIFNKFENNFGHLTYRSQKVKSNNITKYVINEFNNYYNNRQYWHDESSIEHIIPQSTEDDSVFNIGNLICLEEKYNNEAGLDNYKDKRKVYDKSDYKEVKTFSNENKDFLLNQIPIRAKEMASIYYKDILGKNIPKA